jgi:nicotinamidase/pyrazinamidase
MTSKQNQENLQVDTAPKILSCAANAHYDNLPLPIYCFSDEEGGAPFQFDSNAKAEAKQLIDDLQKTFEFDKNIGIIKKIKRSNSSNQRAGGSLIFLGDAQDNSEFDIRILLNLMNIKDLNDGNCILIHGNRDINKIRMFDEFCIVKSVGGVNQWPWKTFKELNKPGEFNLMCASISQDFGIDKTYRFKNSIESLSGAFDKNTVVFKRHLELSFTAELDRVPRLYENTFGAPNAINYRIKELKDHCKIEVGDGKDKGKAAQHVAVCILNMVMGANWSPEDLEGLPESIKCLNGLYIKYICFSHTFATFVTEANENGAVSHGGFPFYDGKHQLSSPLGRVIEGAEEVVSIEKAMKELNTTIQELVNLFDIQKPENATKLLADNYLLRGAENDKNSLIERYIMMSAGVGCIEKDPAEKCTHTHEMSPIVSATGAQYDKSVRDIFIEKNGQRTAMHYNIFGHMPVGLYPKTWKHEHTLHVCVDVSKAETFNAMATNTSFALFVIKGKSLSSLIGRIKFPDKTDKMYVMNDIAYLGKNVYYDTSVLPNYRKIVLQNEKNKLLSCEVDSSRAKHVTITKYIPGALIVVDVQKCFTKGGSLVVDGGDDIIDKINKLAPLFVNVIYTKDYHPKEHVSFRSQHKSNTNVIEVTHGDKKYQQKLWPDHCLISKLHDALEIPAGAKVMTKGYDKGVDSYSAFKDATSNEFLARSNSQNNSKRSDKPILIDRKLDGTQSLGTYLKDRGITDVYVAGIALDYSVAATAVDAHDLGFNVTIILNATAAFNKDSAVFKEATKELFEKCNMVKDGISIIKIDDNMDISHVTDDDRFNK